MSELSALRNLFGGDGIDAFILGSGDAHQVNCCRPFYSMIITLYIVVRVNMWQTLQKEELLFQISQDLLELLL
jgi:hypothetical protein